MSIDPLAWARGKIENRDYPSIGYYQYNASWWKMVAIILVLIIAFGWSYTFGSAVGADRIHAIVQADVKQEVATQMQAIQQTLNTMSGKLQEVSDAQHDQAKDIKRIMNKPEYNRGE